MTTGSRHGNAAPIDLQELVIVSAVRLPIGRFGGALRDFRVHELGALAIAAALARSGLTPDRVDEVFVAHNRQSGNGPNPGRTAAVRAGLPVTVPAHTVNMACPAGLRATIEAAQALRLGDIDVAIVCGMESMSTIPHLLPNARWEGFRSGNIVIEDEFFSAVEPLSGCSALELAELTATKFGISRADQEAYAVASHHKASQAWREGWFADEVIAVDVPATKSRPAVHVARDECIREDASCERMARLPPAVPGGSVTAATASAVTDGAGAFVLTTRRVAAACGLRPLASLVAYRQIGIAPADMLEGPAIAIPAVLQAAGMTLEDIDLIEVNEAFAAQVIANERVLGWDRTKLNVHGGAIALGHPTGFTGVRQIVALCHALRTHGGKLGLIALCGGGGLGLALILRRAD
ncbi:MAG: thiolase family protein [Gammaproteobacteria bacterium]|nr:thiolase family protein [Gammaproteobacteria bacterium]